MRSQEPSGYWHMQATSFGYQSNDISCLRVPTPNTDLPLRTGTFHQEKPSVYEPNCTLRVSMVMLVIKWSPSLYVNCVKQHHFLIEATGFIFIHEESVKPPFHMQVKKKRKKKMKSSFLFKWERSQLPLS